jgi:hypothetical protein
MWSLREHVVRLWDYDLMHQVSVIEAVCKPPPAASRRVPGVHRQLDGENPQARKVPGSTHPGEPLRQRSWRIDLAGV